jgi:hypothetical protein
MRFRVALLIICQATLLTVSAAVVGDLPAGYSAITSTDFGKALFAEKPDATSVTAALESTLPDLGKYFDARPTIKGAYEDSKTHESGGALFTAVLAGQPMKGVISAKLADKGAAVTVIYCRIDAPAAEWTKLTTAPPAAGSAPAPAPTTAPTDIAKVLGDNAQIYQFPDGTGSITLADGWKTQAQSAISAIFIKGPADQNIFIGASINVQTPDSPMVKMVEDAANGGKSAAASFHVHRGVQRSGAGIARSGSAVRSVEPVQRRAGLASR